MKACSSKKDKFILSYRINIRNICASQTYRKRDVGGYSKGVHLFPFRTEQLSPLAPMVLHSWESRSLPTFFLFKYPLLAGFFIYSYFIPLFLPFFPYFSSVNVPFLFFTVKRKANQNTNIKRYYPCKIHAINQ